MPLLRELVLRSLDAAGANSLAFATTRSSLRVLGYHGVWQGPAPHYSDTLFIGSQTFRERLATLASLRCNVLPLMEALDAMRTNSLPKRAVAITIDDGWSSNFNFMLPELYKYRYPATVYLQTQKLVAKVPVHDVAITYALSTTSACTAELPSELRRRVGALGYERVEYQLGDPSDRRLLSKALNEAMENAAESSRVDLLKEVFSCLDVEYGELERVDQFGLASKDVVRSASADFEMALHTHSHSLGDFSQVRIASEIEKNRAVLGGIIDRPPTEFKNFCWPSGEYTLSACRHLSSLGISAATTCEYGLVSQKSSPLLIPRVLDGERTTNAAYVARLSGVRGFFR